jgi:hypothetical protein
MSDKPRWTRERTTAFKTNLTLEKAEIKSVVHPTLGGFSTWGQHSGPDTYPVH